MANISVIIVNYNSPNDVINSVNSAADEIRQVGNISVYIVDNASTDNSVKILQDSISENNWSFVTLLKSERNLGFAGGNNIALRHILNHDPKLKYIYLLNPDTQCFPSTITHLSAFLDTHPAVGVVGGASVSVEGKPQTAHFRFPSFLGEMEAVAQTGFISKILKNYTVPLPESKMPTQCDWVSGCSLMFRFELLQKIGLMDENYFLYYEELDFCLQIKRLGYEIWHNPTSRIIHIEGKTTGIKNQLSQPKRRPSYWFFSRNYYFTKNHGLVYALTANFFWILGYFIYKSKTTLIFKPIRVPKKFGRDFLKTSLQPILISLARYKIKP